MRTSIIFLLSGLLSGCGAVQLGQMDFEGANASAFCTKGGPGGTSGIGPGGIVTGAKVNDGFVGTVMVAPDCSLVIGSEARPSKGQLVGR